MRVSVLGAVERRRRWSREEKIRLVTETFADGITVKEVGERHGVATSLLFQWRRQARLGLFGYGGSEGFAPAAMIEGAWASRVWSSVRAAPWRRLTHRYHAGR